MLSSECAGDAARERTPAIRIGPERRDSTVTEENPYGRGGICLATLLPIALRVDANCSGSDLYGNRSHSHNPIGVMIERLEHPWVTDPDHTVARVSPFVLLR
jgi:hypothetical protein